MDSPATDRPIALRTDWRPGDFGAVVGLHGVVYAAEHGFDISFEAYVAEPLAQFVRTRSERERLWLAERDGRLAGCIALVARSPEEAQLRWFLVEPSARGRGLGRRLLGEALAFARDAGYASVVLFTVRAMETARRLYRDAGFVLVEERPRVLWGVDVIEEKHALSLTH